MPDKTWGRTVLGWFVVADDGNPAASAHGADSADPAFAATDALIAKYAAAAPTLVPPAADGAAGDYAKVYEAAGVQQEASSRVIQARDLLRSLPADTPAATKKQIVEASLKAFNVSTDKIIEAAVSQIEALQAYIVAGQRDTQRLLDDGSKRIGALEAEVADVKQSMQQALTHQQSRQSGANNEKLNVQQVLEFFGRDVVAQVVQKSARQSVPDGDK